MISDRSVLERFGIRDEPIPLAGGEGRTVRAGEVVLKRVHDPDEAAWTQELLSRIEAGEFRIATPIATLDGHWVHDGWSASEFIEGLQPAAPSWDDIIAAGLRLADAADQVRVGGQDILSRRTHRWAVADRVAWGEADVELSEEAVEVRGRLSSLLGDARTADQFVHGDLSGNVFFDPARVPVILDVSPYLRPRRWSAAIVVADFVLWNGADTSLATSFASGSMDRDLLARALTFRLVAEQLADDPRHSAMLEPYHRVLTALL